MTEQVILVTESVLTWKGTEELKNIYREFHFQCYSEYQWLFYYL